jgi:hypothetical protein
LNCQNIRQDVALGPNLSPAAKSVITVQPFPTPPGQQYAYKYIYQPYQPVALSHAAATYSDFEREFTPVAELRLEAKYQITRSITFRVGWTGMWMDGIARGNNLINYRVGDETKGDGETPLGIDTSGHKNRQSLFINGLTTGVEINR